MEIIWGGLLFVGIVFAEPPRPGVRTKCNRRFLEV
jgi:hypothetical protein